MVIVVKTNLRRETSEVTSRNRHSELFLIKLVCKMFMKVSKINVLRLYLMDSNQNKINTPLGVSFLQSPNNRVDGQSTDNVNLRCCEDEYTIQQIWLEFVQSNPASLRLILIRKV